MFMRYVKNSERYSYSYPAFVILFNLGMRIGEMAALTWDDVNFKENTITINKTVNRYRKSRLRLYYGGGFSQKQNVYPQRCNE